MIARRRLGAVVLTSLVASGCARGCTSSRPPIHPNPSMDDQPKVLPQTASTFFYDGASMREPVPGTVPIGGLKEDAAFFTGKGADGEFVATMPVTVDEARPPGQAPEIPGRPDLRRHHERPRADARVPLADPSGGPVGDHRPRARAPAQAGGQRHARACSHQVREALR